MRNVHDSNSYCSFYSDAIPFVLITLFIILGSSTIPTTILVG